MENNKKERKQIKIATKDIAVMGVMTAVLCVLGPLSINIPASPVPISAGSLAVYLTAYMLGWKKGSLCTLLYILLGIVGMPVFAGFTGGLAKFAGPTGGYIIGYIPMAIIIGLSADLFPNKKYVHLIGLTIGTLVLYAIGTGWLAWQGHMTFGKALMAGVVPFIPGDIVKVIIAFVIVAPVKERLGLGTEVKKKSAQEEVESHVQGI